MRSDTLFDCIVYQKNIRTLRATIVALCLLAWASPAVVSASSNLPDPAAFDIADLGTFGGETTIAYGINNAGEVTGFSYNAPSPAGCLKAFLFPPLTAIIPDRACSSGQAINDLGQIAGEADQHPGSGDYLPFFYDGVRHDIDISLIGDFAGYGIGINDIGQVVGESTAPGGSETTGYTTQAFFWDRQLGLRGLGRLGGRRSGARGINARSLVVGYSQFSAPSDAPPFTFPWNPGHAFVWERSGGMRDMNDFTVCDGWTSRTVLELRMANAINSHGKIVGLAANKLDSTLHAFLAQRGGACNPVPPYQVSDLGTLPNGGISYALALNNADATVGAAYLDASGIGNNVAALFARDRVVNLHESLGLLDRLGWDLKEATGINDNGEIVGWGFHEGQIRAFKLTPRAHLSAEGSVFPPNQHTLAVMGVNGAGFSGSGVVRVEVHKFDIGGPLVKSGTVTSSTIGEFSWGARVPCGVDLAISAWDQVTGVYSKQGQVNISCYES